MHNNRIILHSDCNSFYASVECHLNPDLRNLPVAVCGNADDRHGIILAKNDIAKKFGVRTGEAIWQAQKKCPNLVNVRAKYEHYIDYSKRIRDIYSDYTDLIEPFGLDEAWLDITGSRNIFGNSVTIAKEIKNRIKNEIGITVSIGLSYNKIFAKLGSDYKKPDALTIISPHNFKKIVWPLDCSELFYVGSATKRKLYSLGIYTIGDIAQMEQSVLVHHFGIWGSRLHVFSNGLDTSSVSPYSYCPPPKSIGNSTTTHRDLCTIEDVKIIFSVLTDSVCRRMREQNLRCKTIAIQVRDNSLTTITRQKTLNSVTNLTHDILNACLELFSKNYNLKTMRAIRSLSVNISDLVPTELGVQLSLFENIENSTLNDTKLESLDNTCDSLKNRFGNFAITSAIMLKDKKLSQFNPKDDHIIHPVGFRVG